MKKLILVVTVPVTRTLATAVSCPAVLETTQVYLPLSEGTAPDINR